MKTIEQAKLDKEKLQCEILERLFQFEVKYGLDCIQEIKFTRWNGSTQSSGPISSVSIRVSPI